MFDGSIIQERDLSRVPSVRRNPVLADMFERLDYMEQRGSGFQKMLDSVQDASNLEVYSDPTTFIVIFKNMNYDNEELKKLVKIKNNEPINDTINEPINDTIKLTKNEKNVLDLIVKEPNITRQDIVEKLNISLSTVARTIDTLQNEKQKIKRVGPNKNGYWEIIK